VDDDSGSRESSTSDEVVSVIREECGLITEELKDVKQRDFQSMISAVTSIQQMIYVLCRLRDKKKLISTVTGSQLLIVAALCYARKRRRIDSSNSDYI